MLMPSETDLLRAIHRQPGDDSLRLRYADWLELHGRQDRAELLRVQTEAEQHRKDSPEHVRLTDRAVALLAKNGRAWSRGYSAELPEDATVFVYKPQCLAQHGILVLGARQREDKPHEREILASLWFQRGFVGEIGLSPERFFALDPSDIQPQGPLPSLQIQLYPYIYDSPKSLIEILQQLRNSPLLDRVSNLRIAGGFGSTNKSNGTNHEALRLLSYEPSLLAKLGGLGISEEYVDDSVLLPILESPLVTNLHELVIDFTKCSHAVVDLLLQSDRFREMTYLDLSGIIDEAKGLRLFGAPGRWPRLRWLTLGSCGLDGLTLRGLMRPGAFPMLEVLECCGNRIHLEAARALLRSGAMPNLRTIGLGANPLTLDDVQALRQEFGHAIVIGFPAGQSHHVSLLPQELWQGGLVWTTEQSE